MGFGSPVHDTQFPPVATNTCPQRRSTSRNFVAWKKLDWYSFRPLRTPPLVKYPSLTRCLSCALRNVSDVFLIEAGRPPGIRSLGKSVSGRATDAPGNRTSPPASPRPKPSMERVAPPPGGARAVRSGVHALAAARARSAIHGYARASGVLKVVPRQPSALERSGRSTVPDCASTSGACAPLGGGRASPPAPACPLLVPECHPGQPAFRRAVSPGPPPQRAGRVLQWAAQRRELVARLIAFAPAWLCSPTRRAPPRNSRPWAGPEGAPDSRPESAPLFRYRARSERLRRRVRSTPARFSRETGGRSGRT